MDLGVLRRWWPVAAVILLLSVAAHAALMGFSVELSLSGRLAR